MFDGFLFLVIEVKYGAFMQDEIAQLLLELLGELFSFLATVSI